MTAGTRIGQVSWSGVLILLLAIGITATLASGLTSYWILAHFNAHVPLSNQSLSIELPQSLPVSVEIIGATSATQGPGANAVTVPVRIRQRLNLNASIDSQMPLKTTIPFRGIIPINTTLHVDTTIKTRILGIPATLPIVTDLPLKLNVPVDLQIPIDQTVHVKFKAPITADIDQLVRIPIPAQLDSRISFRQDATPLSIRKGALDLPLNGIYLQGPAPWGGTLQLGPARTDSMPPSPANPAN